LGLYFLKKFNSLPETIKTVNIYDEELRDTSNEYLNYSNSKSFSVKENSILIKEFLGSKLNFIRVIPGYIINGVNTGRDFMIKKGVKKWGKGDASCKYYSLSNLEEEIVKNIKTTKINYYQKIRKIIERYWIF
jgi:hypothetical protein